jgi:hypothetical protein
LHGPDLVAGGAGLLEVLAHEHQAAPDSGGIRDCCCHSLTSLDAGKKDRLASLALGQQSHRRIETWTALTDTPRAAE